MKRPVKTKLNLIIACLWASLPLTALPAQNDPWQFRPDGCVFTATSVHPYFPLWPGLRWVFRGEEDGTNLQLVREVLRETQSLTLKMAGETRTIETAIVRETETGHGEWVEVAHNYYAQCAGTDSVFYFGRDVEISLSGKVVSRDGTWRAGENGNEAGVVMPGKFVVGDSYLQEFAPGIAEDRALNIGEGLNVTVPAGQFTGVIRVEESNPIEPGAGTSQKSYASGVGLIVDDVYQLVEFRADPVLMIEPAVHLSWPGVSGDFIVECAETVNGPWTRVRAPIHDLAGGKEAWVVATERTKLFRLRRP